MKENFVEQGIWEIASLSSDAKFTLPGNLTWDSSKGMKLEVLPLSFPDAQQICGLYPSRFRVRGETSGRGHITVREAKLTGPLYPFLNLPLSFSASELIVGDALVSDPELTAKRVDVQFSHLELLLETSLLSMPRSETSRFSINLAEDNLLQFASVEGAEIGILHYGTISKGERTASVEDGFQFQIEFESPQSYEAVLSWIREIRDFLTLALDYPTTTKSIRILAPQKPEHGRSMLFNVLRATGSTGRRNDDRVLQSERVLFPLLPIEASRAAFLRFHQLRRQIRMAMDFFFSGYYSNESYMNQMFADVVHGLEGLHRGLRGGSYMDQSAYDTIYPKLIAAIPTSISNDHREALKSRLKFGNEISLRNRLRELAKHHDDYLSEFLGSPKAFSNAVTKLRNDLAHASGEGEPSEQQLFQYFFRFHQSRLLFQVELLSQLGFDQEYIQGRVKRLRSSEAIAFNAHLLAPL